MEKAICLHCDNKTPYFITSEIVTCMIKGEEAVYEEKSAYCCMCGNEVYVPEVHDDNVDTLMKIYAFKMNRGS